MTKVTKKIIQEDPLIKALVDSKGKEVEIIAFEVLYTGKLSKVNINKGIIQICNGEDCATLEIERIQSFKLITSKK